MGTDTPDRQQRLAPLAPQRGARRKRMLAGIAVAALLAGAGYGAWQAWRGPGSQAARPATVAVQRGDLEDAVTATGTLQPRDYVDVGTQVSGQVKKLHVDLGAAVRRGQLLAEIDPTLYQSRVDADRAQLGNLKAQLADRQAQLALAEQQQQRQVNMMREQATTTEALQSAEAALGSARAQIDALKAQLQQVGSTLRGDEANLNYTRIYAPMAGTVVSLTAKQGQTLNANQQAPVVLRIADLSTMTVDAQVSEADVPKLVAGMPVYFTTIGDQAKRWHAKLRQVNPTPQVVNNVVLYDALFEVPNPERALMTQMTAQVFFVTAQAKDAVLVPIAALRPVRRTGAPARPAQGSGAPSTGALDPRLQFADGRASVRVVHADGSFETREIRLGAMNRISAQVLEGLEPGEQVAAGMRPPTPAGARPAAPNSPQNIAPRFGARL